MTEIIATALSYLKSHIAILMFGFMGACLNVLLSSEGWRDRLVGALAGFILCIAFAQHASNILADGQYPEVFGFLLGAMGKSTAETLLAFMRTKVLQHLNQDNQKEEK